MHFLINKECPSGSTFKSCHIQEGRKHNLPRLGLGVHQQNFAECLPQNLITEYFFQIGSIFDKSSIYYK
jgi:hypothetical protein